MGICVRDVVTLSQGDYCLMEVKRQLLRLRRIGLVFFSEEIASLTETKEFDLYIAYKKKQIHKEDAFPIPIRIYRYEKDKKKRYEYLSRFYRNYYEKELTPELFKLYDQNRPYIGQKFVWFSKTQAN